MIVRPVLPCDSRDRLAGGVALGIAQPTHSWISAQLAEQWDHVLVPSSGYPSELIMAAALHDFGYLGWERHPAWNPKTGLPFSFQEFPC